MRLFYSPNIHQELALNEEQSKHAIKVLRMHSGDVIEVLDGKGKIYTCKILDAYSKSCGVAIIDEKTFEKRTYSIEIVLAPTKNMDRIEWFVEKAIEVGIDKITLIQTSRTERKKVRLDRLQKIAISAMKQSKTYYLPEITELLSFDEVVNSPFNGERFIAHCIDNDKHHLKNCLSANGNAQILIGPEGDFTESEIEMALKNNFKPVSLGENRLRTETAALYACAVASVVNA